jgi:hypothetical protein
MKNYIYLAIVGVALFSAAAVADSREDVYAAMQRCAAVPDDRVWLDCIYGSQQAMRAKLGLPPAPDYQQRLVPPVMSSSRQAQAVPAPIPPRPVRRSRGGLGSLFGDSRAIAASVLVGVRYDSEGAFIATLQNGQVWHQVNVQPGYPKARLTLGSKITIVPGSVWSYDLKIEGSPQAYKVTPENS